MASLVSRPLKMTRVSSPKGARQLNREGQFYYYQNAAGLMADCVVTESVSRKDYIPFFSDHPCSSISFPYCAQYLTGFDAITDDVNLRQVILQSTNKRVTGNFQTNCYHHGICP